VPDVVQVLQVDIVNNKGPELMELDSVNTGEEEGDIIEDEVKENSAMVGSKDDDCVKLIIVSPTTSDGGDSDLMDSSMVVLSADKGGDIYSNTTIAQDKVSLTVSGLVEIDIQDKVSKTPRGQVSEKVGFEIPKMGDVVITGTDVGA
jgi:hypothetical protein